MLVEYLKKLRMVSLKNHLPHQTAQRELQLLGQHGAWATDGVLLDQGEDHIPLAAIRAHQAHVGGTHGDPARLRRRGVHQGVPQPHLRPHGRRGDDAHRPTWPTEARDDGHHDRGDGVCQAEIEPRASRQGSRQGVSRYARACALPRTGRRCRPPCSASPRANGPRRRLPRRRTPRTACSSQSTPSATRGTQGSMVKVPPPWQGPSSAPAPPQGAPVGLWLARHTLRERPAQWAPSHRLGRSSQPPSKPPISPPLTT